MYIVDYHSTDFLREGTRKAKATVVKKVLEHLKANGHRFVEKKADMLWYETAVYKARSKVVQALREGALEWRLLDMEHTTEVILAGSLDSNDKEGSSFDLSNQEEIKPLNMLDIVKSNAMRWATTGNSTPSIVSDTSSIVPIEDEPASIDENWDMDIQPFPLGEATNAPDSIDSPALAEALSYFLNDIP